MMCHVVLHWSLASILVGVSGTSSSIKNGQIWYDTSGERIRAHQPFVHRVQHKSEGTNSYYLYGTAHVGSSDGESGVVNVYTSTDLYNWDFAGVAANFSGYAARVSMIGKNPVSDKYVLWSKGGSSFQVATSDSLLGPFVPKGESYKPKERPNGPGAGDSQAFVDPITQQGYMFYSLKPTKDKSELREVRVGRLSDDWTALVESPVSVVQKNTASKTENLEAPLPFYSTLTEKYYVWCSHTSGWNPNAAKLFEADSPEGPWTSKGNPSGSGTTFDTQGSHIIQLEWHNGVQRLLYQADRYIPYVDTEEGSRSIFLPLEITKAGAAKLIDAKDWTLEAWPSGSFPSTL